MDNHNNKILAIIIAGLLLGGFYITNAAFNEQINYQGKLTDSNDVAISDDDYCMKFLLYPHLTATSD